MLQILSSLYLTPCDKVTNTVIIVPDITRQGYKYCHHCTWHRMKRLQILSSLYLPSLTRLQIQSSLYLTSHEKVTNTAIIVPNITWRGHKYCHHCTQHHMTRLQILSSMYPISQDKITNTVIIVPNITWRGYKDCHHCTQHHMTRSQILSSLYPTSHDEVTNTDKKTIKGSIVNKHDSLI